ncbi:glycosyltransferase [Vibrio fujianensis]|uniref:glycosyltransferase n=1 Tax=Vibrio fujianensis TaxID=1974215 RepID=UPI000C170180|nr:glycosyltransferase [Vibrio fujianensis]
MSSPKISVVMSVYNGEKYLGEAIDSILKQTFSDFEFIIINDGSTDKTLEIIKSYMKKDDRIVLVSRENKGLIVSLNEGLDLAKGQYIARMDADDISIKSRFEKQIEFLDSNPDIGVCGTWVEVFGENIKSKKWKMPTQDPDLKAKLTFSVPFAHPTVMIRKKVIDKYKINYDLGYKDAEDYKFWVDFSKYTLFSNVPEILLRYRYHQESISRVADNKENKERFEIISKIQNEVLTSIGIVLTNEGAKNHFILSLNERILNNVTDCDVIRAHLLKISSSQIESSQFDSSAIERLMLKKYFIYLILSIRRDKDLSYLKIFDLMFLKGAFLFLKDRMEQF